MVWLALASRLRVAWKIPVPEFCGAVLETAIRDAWLKEVALKHLRDRRSTLPTKSSIVISRLGLAFLIAALPVRADNAAQKGSSAVRISPSIAETIATNKTLPRYPDSSFKLGHQGVVVVDISVSSRTAQVECNVLQAPDTSIALAVVTAVQQWQFKPFLVDGMPASFRSRLLFYFLVKQGKPSVIDPVSSSVDSH